MKKMERDTVFYKKLFELMIPIMLQNLMLALVAVADAFMLGGVDQNYMSAVSLATQIQFIQNMFLTAATASLGILGAQYWGKGDLKTLDDIFCMALRLCGLVSVVFFAACMFIPKYLMILFTNESVLIGYGVDYLRIAAFSYLLTGISQCYLVIMKTSEHAKTTAIISSFTVCINILLNAVFIYGWFGIAPMGVKGAALATLISRILELVISVVISYMPGYIYPKLADLFSGTGSWHWISGNARCRFSAQVCSGGSDLPPIPHLWGIWAWTLLRQTRLRQSCVISSAVSAREFQARRGSWSETNWVPAIWKRERPMESVCLKFHWSAVL